MEIVHRDFTLPNRNSVIEIIPLGDPHIGKDNQAETPLKKVVSYIASNLGVYWIGGGDYLECIKPSDKRYDNSNLPDWILKGDIDEVKKRLSDIVACQQERFLKIIAPIKSKCLGLIEGNHEYALRQKYNTDVCRFLCAKLETPELTDEAIIRLRFTRPGGSSSVLKIYIRHGKLAGRSVAVEARHLERMLNEFDADICLRGHSHTHLILPPVPIMTIPSVGVLPPELIQKYRWAANWGCWLYSHKRGASTYESRAEYAAKPMMALKIRIQPFSRILQNKRDFCVPKIELLGIPL